MYHQYALWLEQNPYPDIILSPPRLSLTPSHNPAQWALMLQAARWKALGKEAAWNTYTHTQSCCKKPSVDSFLYGSEDEQHLPSSGSHPHCGLSCQLLLHSSDWCLGSWALWGWRCPEEPVCNEDGADRCPVCALCDRHLWGVFFGLQLVDQVRKHDQFTGKGQETLKGSWGCYHGDLTLQVEEWGCCCIFHHWLFGDKRCFGSCLLDP